MEDIIREYVSSCIASGLSEENVVENVRSVYAAERNKAIKEAIEVLVAQGYDRSQILNMPTIWGKPTLGEIVTILDYLENNKVSGGR